MFQLQADSTPQCLWDGLCQGIGEEGLYVCQTLDPGGTIRIPSWSQNKEGLWELCFADLEKTCDHGSLASCEGCFVEYEVQSPLFPV